MRSLYLIAAAVAVAVKSEPQRSNNDIIWYPVDDEEGVFISTLGEKRRTAEEFKWRSHRRARYSGTGLPLVLSRDPSENRDPSFFHNVNDRIPFTPVPKIPPAFQDRQYLFDSPKGRPLQQTNQNTPGPNFQEIINEVFDYKHPSATEISGGEWGGRPGIAYQGQWSDGVRTPPAIPQSTWGTSSFPVGGRPGQRPTAGASQTVERPGGAEWVIPQSGSTRKPGNRPAGGESDRLVFPGETSGTSTTPDVLPTDPPTPSPCERKCPVTPEFNPVCGSDAVTYSNAGRLKCAQMCGKNVRLSHHGNCGRTPFVTPLVSNNPKSKFRGFF